jgi:CrcB protein
LVYVGQTRSIVCVSKDVRVSISSGWHEFREGGRNEILARAQMTKYCMVGLGGFLGSIARFWLGSYITYRMGARFPYGTFVINMSGSFLIGLVVTLLAERAHWSPNLLYLIPIGFIGAYTTFSTFELEAFRSVQNGHLLLALLNVILSVTVGFLAVWLGVVTGKTLG